MNKNEDALEKFNKAISADPANSQAYFGRAYLTDEKEETLNKALEDYNQAISLDPQFIWAYYNRGFLKSNLGDFAGAEEDYRKVCELEPTANNLTDLAALLIRRNKFKEANDFLNEAEGAGLDEEYELIHPFLKGLLKMLSGGSSDKIFASLNKILKTKTGRVELDWEFDKFIDWLDGSGLDANQIEKVRLLINRLENFKKSNKSS